MDTLTTVIPESECLFYENSGNLLRNLGTPALLQFALNNVQPLIARRQFIGGLVEDRGFFGHIWLIHASHVVTSAVWSPWYHTIEVTAEFLDTPKGKTAKAMANVLRDKDELVLVPVFEGALTRRDLAGIRTVNFKILGFDLAVKKHLAKGFPSP